MPRARHWGVPNRLSESTSPYLQQHADNPVDWWEWTEEAFAEARRRDVPIFLSIGYSACHWCHVMAHESFEDPKLAEVLNAGFVSIKVDREERPDVDAIYMDATVALTGHGGWPMSVFLDHQGRPFYAGTYFPPQPRHGMPSFGQLLEALSQAWSQRRGEVEGAGERITEALRKRELVTPMAPPPGDTVLARALEALDRDFDERHAGFGGAPKFPPSMALEFCLREAARTGDARALRMAERTLEAMARGGMYDQLGGGFARYSVDAAWVVPHFEKMLYDNALLLGTYAEAWARYRDPLHAAVCEETVAWLLREMRVAPGRFASSLDADTDHHEGTTYVWTRAELREALGEAADAFIAAYGVTDAGNFEGSNVLRLSHRPGLRAQFARERAALLAARDRRPQPARDDGPLDGWNALLAAGLARAAWIFGRKDWHALAAETAAAALRSLAARPEAPLNDHVWTAEALLAVAATSAWAGGPDTASLRSEASRLMRGARERFRDPVERGWFLTAAGRTDLAVRQKDWFDNATPASNSSLVHVLSALSALEPEGGWSEELSEHAGSYGGACRNVPAGVAHALEGLVREATGIVTVKAAPGADWEGFRKALLGDGASRPHAQPWRPVHLVEQAGSEGWQVCAARTCLAPAASATAAAALV